MIKDEKGGRQIDAKHSGLRGFFRVFGPLIVLASLVLCVIGFVSFFSAFGSGEPPRFFWCIFVGFPLGFVGLVFCKLGYMGRIARYVAQEIAPVGKDTFNYMAEGTRDGLHTVAQAIGQGLKDGMNGVSETEVRCHECNNLVDCDAKFCDRCGQELS